MFRAYQRYFDFGGRASRSEFWLFVLWCLIASTIGAIIDYGALGWSNSAGELGPYGPALWLIIAFNFIPSLSVAIRRLHDKDKSGWFYLLCLVPIVGSIVLLVWFCQAGTPGANRFGPPTGAKGRHPAVTPVGDGDLLQKLEQLGRLRDQGVLTEAEFSAQKAAVLAG